MVLIEESKLLLTIPSSVTVHDLEFEQEIYSNFKNIDSALNSYTLLN